MKTVHNGAWQYPSGAGASKVWTSDASGVGSWGVAAGTGDVVGPGSATDNALARFDTATGKLLQNSVGILTDAGVLSGLTGIIVPYIDGGTGNLNLTANATGEVTVNDAAEDVDFRVEGNSDANLFVVDASTDRVGVGGVPSMKLEVFDTSNQNSCRVENKHAAFSNTVLFLDADAVASSGYYLFRARTDVAISAVSRFEIRGDGSLTVGAPTGGFKGAGTINVENGIYDGGTRVALSGANTDITNLALAGGGGGGSASLSMRSEEHTSELQSH